MYLLLIVYVVYINRGISQFGKEDLSFYLQCVYIYTYLFDSKSHLKKIIKLLHVYFVPKSINMLDLWWGDELDI